MSQRTVTRRYAQALYEEANRTDQVDTIDADIEVLLDALDASDELVRFFESPVIPQDKKRDVIRALFEDNVSALTLRFLLLLLEKDRETMTQPIAERYQRLRDEQQNIVEVEARVAHALNEEARTQLTDALEDMLDQRVRLNVSEDESLIGGVVVRIGDTVYDGSVQNQLANLHDRLRENTSVSLDNGAA
jgi:F-type H+-transporting ATPase subunit delta